MACEVVSNSVRRDVTSASPRLEATAASSLAFIERSVESRWIMGQSVVAMPRRVSTLLNRDSVSSGGGKGARPIASGGLDRGAVPSDRAAMTS